MGVVLDAATPPGYRVFVLVNRWGRCAQPPANSFQAFGLLLVSEGL